MRRRRPYRIVALPLALWFVALATDVGGVDACPMHDAMAAAMAGMAGMAGMAMPQLPTMTQAPASPNAPLPTGPIHCTCMGACCGCAMATLPSTSGMPFVAATAVRTQVPIEPTQRPLPAAAPFVLPPAIGPPALQA